MRRLLTACTILLGIAGTVHAQSIACRDGTVVASARLCPPHGGLPLETAPTTLPIPQVAPPPAVRPAPVPAPGGAGQVWVNPRSHVYHCPGTQYYGKTKQGRYMTEAVAKAEGARPAYGHVCS